MSEEHESSGGTADVAKATVTKKIGPLPLFGWVIGGAALALAWRHFHPKAAASPSTSVAVGNPNPAGEISSMNGSILDTLQSLDQRFQAEQSGIASSSSSTQSGIPSSGNAPTDTTTSRIQDLYQSVFGRAADPSGLTYYTGVANSQGIGAVQTALASSGEGKAVAAYRQYLGRSGQGDTGLSYWTNRYNTESASTVDAAFAAAAQKEAAKK